MIRGSAMSGRGGNWVASHWKALASIVVAIAVIAVAVVVSNPFTPTHRATLKLEFMGAPGARFTVTIDGHLVENGSLPGHFVPLWLTINVTWKGNNTHLCSIVVVSLGAGIRHAQSVWMKDGATVSESYYIYLPNQL